MDYKKYSLENLENWLHDALSAGEASAEEVYNTIKKVVQEQYYHHKHHASQAYELLALLNGNGIDYVELYDNRVDKILKCDKDDQSSECKGAWNDFWENDTVEYDLREAEYYQKGDKVTKWVLPVQVDGLTGECYIELPDDLLEVAGLKEGDTVEWIEHKNGSFEMRKVTK